MSDIRKREEEEEEERNETAMQEQNQKAEKAEAIASDFLEGNERILLQTGRICIRCRYSTIQRELPHLQGKLILKVQIQIPMEIQALDKHHGLGVGDTHSALSAASAAELTVR